MPSPSEATAEESGSEGSSINDSDIIGEDEGDVGDNSSALTKVFIETGSFESGLVGGREDSCGFERASIGVNPNLVRRQGEPPFLFLRKCE